jgi:shikimate kinase
MARVLVTGMSGTGKSSALTELERLGYRVVDTDDPGWSEWIRPTADAEGEWLWREEPMAELLGEQDERPLFVAGCVRNQGAFYDRFDAVVLLSAPAEVILERVGGRTTNPYGKGPGERELILHHIETVEPLLRATSTHELDSRRPLGEVVAALVPIAEEAAS